MNFRELLEATPITFELQVDGDITATNSNADVIQNKVTRAMKKSKNIKVMRTDKYGTEDVTKLFVK